MQRQLITEAKRVVLKIGSSLVASRSLGLRHDLIQRLSRDIAELKARSVKLCWYHQGPLSPAWRN